MDQRQRDLIDSKTRDLAEKINFERLACALQTKGVVSKEKIDEILLTKYEFTRNIKLLNALQESNCSAAFDILIQALDEDNNKEALKLLRPSSFGKILKKMSDTFSKSPARLPLGINSGIPSTSSFSPGHNNEEATSPLKEKHQATLITSGTNGQTGNLQTTFCDSGLTLNGSSGSSGSTVNFQPRASENAAADLPSNHANFRLRQVRPVADSLNTGTHSVQTFTRPQDLALNNLTLNDNDYNYRDRSGDEAEIVWHPYATKDAQRSSSPETCVGSHYCLPPSPDSDSSSGDSVIVDSTLILDPNVTMAIAQSSPYTMTVKKASVLHNNREEDYKMTARPRGPCLIINNIDFQAEMLPTRKGSDEDARRFDDIFRQLGFTVIMRRNQTADQMKAVFKEVAGECKPEHDALFVFILSHGSEYGIYGTDGLEVCLESEVISCFDNRNCKAMLGKPKVFVIQACRGRAKDCGGDGDTLDSIAWPSVAASPSLKTPSQENRVPDSWLQRHPADGKKRKHPIRTDMLLVFSCLAGFVSVRNETAGSWLGVALAYFIMTHAHERDFQRILNLVNRDVIQRESSNGHIQSIEMKYLGWTKNLYFNPGIYL